MSLDKKQPKGYRKAWNGGVKPPLPECELLRMPPCATCGHGWRLHVIPGGVENIDIYPHERHCVDCGCRNYVEPRTGTARQATIDE